MFCIGLKLWSTNTGPLMSTARCLFAEGIFDYIELIVVPNSEQTLDAWAGLKDFGIPFVIHNAHSAQGFNLAMRSAAASNLRIYSETRNFADTLGAERIIFHGGADGDIEETIRQLKAFNESRALVENKPFVPLKNPLGLARCRGATRAELEQITAEVGCGFCLDIGHAVCSANSQEIEPYEYIKELSSNLKPKMFHLSDVKDMASPYDAHPHLGTGCLDIARLKREIFDEGAVISIETVRDSMMNLDDFKRDVEYLRQI